MHEPQEHSSSEVVSERAPVALRPAVGDDEPFLFDVYAATRAAELELTSWGEAERRAFLEMQFAAQHAYYRSRFPGATYDIVLSGGRPVGRLYVSRGADELRILDLSLLPRERNAGIGTALVDGLTAEARREGVPVRIYVEPHNPSRRLFERFGFAPAGELAGHVLLEWRPPAAEHD